MKWPQKASIKKLQIKPPHRTFSFMETVHIDPKPWTHHGSSCTVLFTFWDFYFSNLAEQVTPHDNAWIILALYLALLLFMIKGNDAWIPAQNKSVLMRWASQAFISMPFLCCDNKTARDNYCDSLKARQSQISNISNDFQEKKNYQEKLTSLVLLLNLKRPFTFSDMPA